MHTFRKIIRELHRRSVWQVLGVFLAGSWGVLQVVDFLTERAGLPDWTPTFALVLLLVGLPIVLATAFVQEGLPGDAQRREEPEAAMARIREEVAIEGLPPSAVHRVPELHPLHGARLFTWRNALLGGIGAGALLIAAVASYFLMWGMGIGPVGSLVAQGVIDEGDRVVLADFANVTADASLGSVVTEALRIDLLESPVVDLVDPADVGGVLRRMKVEPEAPLTAALAREVAEREGVKAVLAGEVGAAGSGYVLTATLLSAETGRALAAFRVTARSADDVIGAIDDLSRRIREKAGESLRSIRAGAALDQVTTASLDALRLYAEAEESFERGDHGRTIALLGEAVALDSTFAMAWRRLAVVYSNTGLDRAAEVDAAARAYHLRNRLTEKERYLAEAFYQSEVAGDDERTAQAYRNVLEIDADDPRALNNLANLYQGRDDLERAAKLYRRAIGGPGVSNTAFQNLIRNRIAAGRTDEAGEVLSNYAARYPDDSGLPAFTFWVRFMSGDLAAAEAVVRPIAEDRSLHPVMRAEAYDELARVSMRRGRIAEALARLEDAERAAARSEPSFAWLRRMWTAHTDIILGDRSRGAARIRSGMRDGTMRTLPGPARMHYFAALDLAFSGDPDGADEIATDFAALPEAERSRADERHLDFVRAVARFFAGDTVGALGVVAGLRSDEGCSRCYRTEEAMLREAMGDAAGAVRLHEAVLTEPYAFLELNAVYGTLALVRLGPLYEELGDTDAARAAYGRLTEAWRDADAGGRPVVERARARMAALGGE